MVSTMDNALRWFPLALGSNDERNRNELLKLTMQELSGLSKAYENTIPEINLLDIPEIYVEKEVNGDAILKGKYSFFERFVRDALDGYDAHVIYSRNYFDDSLFEPAILLYGGQLDSDPDSETYGKRKDLHDILRLSDLIELAGKGFYGKSTISDFAKKFNEQIDETDITKLVYHDLNRMMLAPLIGFRDLFKNLPEDQSRELFNQTLHNFLEGTYESEVSGTGFWPAMPDLKAFQDHTSKESTKRIYYAIKAAEEYWRNSEEYTQCLQDYLDELPPEQKESISSNLRANGMLDLYDIVGIIGKESGLHSHDTPAKSHKLRNTLLTASLVLASLIGSGCTDPAKQQEKANIYVYKEIGGDGNPKDTIDDFYLYTLEQPVGDEKSPNPTPTPVQPYSVIIKNPEAVPTISGKNELVEHVKSGDLEIIDPHGNPVGPDRVDELQEKLVTDRNGVPLTDPSKFLNIEKIGKNKYRIKGLPDKAMGWEVDKEIKDKPSAKIYRDDVIEVGDGVDEMFGGVVIGEDRKPHAAIIVDEDLFDKYGGDFGLKEQGKNAKFVPKSSCIALGNGLYYYAHDLSKVSGKAVGMIGPFQPASSEAEAEEYARTDGDGKFALIEFIKVIN